MIRERVKVQAAPTVRSTWLFLPVRLARRRKNPVTARAKRRLAPSIKPPTRTLPIPLHPSTRGLSLFMVSVLTVTVKELVAMRSAASSGLTTKFMAGYRIPKARGTAAAL